MRFVFLDTEFTGEHVNATLVSLGLVGMNDEHLHVTFNDYAEDQVTDWLRENVLKYIDCSQSVDQKTGLGIVRNWLEQYSRGERISLVSMGKLQDITFLFELYRFDHPERKYFHYLHCLPDYLNHAAHFDLATMFYLAGLQPDLDREAFAGVKLEGVRHNALYDARIVRACFLKLIHSGHFPDVPVISDT